MDKKVFMIDFEIAKYSDSITAEKTKYKIYLEIIKSIVGIFF